MDKNSEILLTLSPTIGRRVIAAGSLGALGVLLLNFGFETQGLWSAFFLLFGAVVLFGAHRLWLATGGRLELTRTELRTGTGRVLTPISNVKSIDRGAFAFKPSNGFLVKLEEPHGAGWSPGLWWQRGRLLGIGGVVRGGESRAMAEFIMAIKDGTFDELF